MIAPRESALALTCGSVLTGLILLIVGRDYPFLGHDYRYFIPRLLDTDLHIRVNGMSVQWYTPTFGGGLPAFANPQHLQHSVIQALTWLVDPWLAITITTALVSLAGFYAFYVFLRRRMQLAPLPAILGAVFFIGNGFYIEHLVVGHMGFQLFPLMAVLLAALTDVTRAPLRNACVVALIGAAMMFHAGVYLIILIALSLALTLPLLYLLDTRLVAPRRVAIVAAAGAILFALITASKMYVVLALMRYFPREIADVHHAGVLQGIAGLAAQLVGAMVLVPVFLVAQIDLARFPGALNKLVGTGERIGVWELDTGLSPVLTVILCAAAVRLLAHLARGEKLELAGGRLLAFVILCVTTWIVVEAALAKGLVYPHIKGLPILRSLHVNPRIASAFILPLSIAGAAAVNQWSRDARYRSYLVAAIGVAILSPLVYLPLPASMQLRSFDVTTSLQDSDRIRSGERFVVTHIADVSDAAALSTGASSYRPYEGIFGYQLETFAAQTHPGSVRDVRDGAFNMTHPASLVFPVLNGVHPFERIRVADGETLEMFVNRRQPPWRLPRVLHILNWVSAAALALTVLGLILPRPIGAPPRSPAQ